MCVERDCPHAMQERNDVTVIEAQPEDIVGYVEDDDRLAGSVGDVFDSHTIEFRYATHVDGEHDADLQPVLNSRGIKKVVEMGCVRWTIDGHEVHMVMDTDRDRDDITKELKEAFGAHNRDADTSKDPRRLWREREDE